MSLDTTACPEFTTDDQRCANIAEITDRFVLESTGGPVEHVRTVCLEGHVLMGPTAMLYVQKPNPIDSESEN
ncbi:hypothetical protein BH23PAT2_BH23PAT2_10540 [soil metagenome]